MDQYEKTKNYFRAASGQGLTEYVIILCLVAVSSIVVMALFGGAIKDKVASLAGAVAGQDSKAIAKSEQNAKTAFTKATTNAADTSGGTTIDKNDVDTK